MHTLTTLNASQTVRKILIADDHHLVLDAIRVMMTPQYEVMGVDSCQAFINAVDGFRPDVAILDVSMPDNDGFQAAQRALERQPSLPVMFLSTYVSSEYISRAAELGAKAYLSKRIAGHELVAAIELVLDGNNMMPGVGSPDEGPANAQDEGRAGLTARQRQVLTLIARGGSAKDIANSLNISVRTAEFHRAAIMQRLGLHSTAQMTRYAVSNNLG